MPNPASPSVAMLPEMVVVLLSPPFIMPYARVPVVVILPKMVVVLLESVFLMPYALSPGPVLILPELETITLLVPPVVKIPASDSGVSNAPVTVMVSPPSSVFPPLVEVPEEMSKVSAITGIARAKHSKLETLANIPLRLSSAQGHDPCIKTNPGGVSFNRLFFFFNCS